MTKMAMTLKILWSNFRCINMASTKADFVVASKQGTRVAHLVSSIWVTATEVAVRTSSRSRIRP